MSEKQQQTHQRPGTGLRWGNFSQPAQQQEGMADWSRSSLATSTYQCQAQPFKPNTSAGFVGLGSSDTLHLSPGQQGGTNATQPCLEQGGWSRRCRHPLWPQPPQALHCSLRLHQTGLPQASCHRNMPHFPRKADLPAWTGCAFLFFFQETEKVRNLETLSVVWT